MHTNTLHDHDDDDHQEHESSFRQPTYIDTVRAFVRWIFSHPHHRSWSYDGIQRTNTCRTGNVELHHHHHRRRRRRRRGNQTLLVHIDRDPSPNQ